MTASDSTAWRRAAPWFIPLWSLAILAGVVFLRVERPEDLPPLIRALVRVEAVHVVAHLFLYGTLASACVVWSPRLLRGHAAARTLLPLAIVCVVGVVQEAAQTVLFGRPMGPPEAFDVGVDATAAAIVILVSWRLRRRAPGQALSSATGVLE